MLKTVGFPSTRTGDQTIVNGSLVIATTGEGVDFSANSNTPGMTKEVLDWYEEGTWTPAQGSGLTVVGAFTSSGTYTRIGRVVTVRGKVDGATSVACASAGQICTGLPYAPAADTAGTWFNGSLSAGGVIDAASAGVYAVGAIAATPSIFFAATYMV